MFVLEEVFLYIILYNFFFLKILFWFIGVKEIFINLELGIKYFSFILIYFFKIIVYDFFEKL